MGFLEQNTQVDITSTSGVIRVTISSDPNFIAAAFQTACMTLFFWIGAHSLLNLPRIWQIGIALAATVTATRIFRMVRHSEQLIEFGKEKLKIGRVLAGFERTSEYDVQKCTGLTWREPRESEDGSVLEFKYGLRKVSFGAGLSAQQAQEILASLQQYMPETAQTMGMSHASAPSHFTRLRLN